MHNDMMAAPLPIIRYRCARTRQDSLCLPSERASPPARQPKLVQMFGLRARDRRAAAGDGVAGSDAAVPWRNCSPHQIDPNASNGKGEGRGRKPTEASEDADEEKTNRGKRKRERRCAATGAKGCRACQAKLTGSSGPLIFPATKIAALYYL